MPIKKINPGDPISQSADLVHDNIDKLKALFPEIVTEGKIDFKVLQQVLGRRIGSSRRILPFYLGRKVASKTRSAQTLYGYFTTLQRKKVWTGTAPKTCISREII